MTSDQEKNIEKTVAFVKATLADAEGGHDWWHIERVWKLSRHIAEKENADKFVVELGALLHDIADFKFYDGDEEIGPRKAREFLASIEVEEKIIEAVEKIIVHISFKGENHLQEYKSPELDIVQDADRLDGLGAMGIARTFHYGGHKHRVIYDPGQPPKLQMSKEEYINNNSSSINHFYEKLLLLKDRMNTKTGKVMAEHRHNFLEKFLEEFYKEWNGEL